MTKRNCTILVVDDDKDIRETLYIRLSQKGYAVESVSSAEEALAVLPDLDVKLFLIDIMMAQMSGLELLEKLDVKNNLYEAIIITGMRDFTHGKEAMQLGARSYITKPIDARDLDFQIGKALETVELKNIKHNYTRELEIQVKKRTEELEKEIAMRGSAEEKLRKYQQELQNLTEHLQSIREEERKRVAREIHDELGQVLTALKIDLSWLMKKIPHDEPEVAERIQSINNLIELSIETVKRITMELRPGLLDDLGLEAAIEWQLEEFMKRTGIRCKVSMNIYDKSYDETCTTALFRIVQELLTNITRHANASKIDFSLHERRKTIELTVADNGRGITNAEVYNPESFGLLGIKERARSLGGSADFKSHSGKGTTVKVTIPLKLEPEKQ